MLPHEFSSFVRTLVIVIIAFADRRVKAKGRNLGLYVTSPHIIMPL